MAEYVRIDGTFKWVRSVTADRFTAPDGTVKETWSAVIYPSAGEMDKVFGLQAEGVKNQVKKDDDGYFIKYSRPTTMKAKGQIKTLTPPKVSYNDKPFSNEVPNGAKGTIVLDVYPHKVPNSPKMAKAARFDSLIITSLPDVAPTQGETF